MPGFKIRRDSSANNIPVVGYQDTVDAQDILLWAALQVTDTGNTDGNGIFTATRPIIDMTHDWETDGGGIPRERRIDGKDITAQKADATPLYPGKADGAAKTIPLYTDAGLTTSAANLTNVSVTYWTPVALKADAQGRLVLSPDSLINVAVSSSLPAGTNKIGLVELAAGTAIIGQIQLLDAAGNTLAAKNMMNDNHQNVQFPLATVGYGYLWNGVGWDRARTPYVVKQANLTANGTVWTPPVGQNANLMKAVLNVGKPATSGDLIGVQITDSGTPITPTFWLGAGQFIPLDFGNGWATTGTFDVAITGSLAAGSSVAVWMEGTVE